MMPSFMLLSLIFIISHFATGNLPPAKNVGNPCGGNGWQHWAEGGKCMKLFPAKTGWNVAEINCGYEGGHHISVRDIGENQFVAGKSGIYRNGL
jgi:hypothetical protein